MTAAAPPSDALPPPPEVTLPRVAFDALVDLVAMTDISGGDPRFEQKTYAVAILRQAIQNVRQAELVDPAVEGALAAVSELNEAAAASRPPAPNRAARRAKGPAAKRAAK